MFQRQKTEEDTFLFTLNGNDYEKGIVYEDEYLNCIALVVDEIVSDEEFESGHEGPGEVNLFKTKKAY